MKSKSYRHPRVTSTRRAECAAQAERDRTFRPLPEVFREGVYMDQPRGRDRKRQKRKPWR